MRLDQVLQVLPRHADVLARVFPVLERVVVSYQITRIRQESLEPHEARAMAFRALKALLAHLADIHPVVVIIDDIQWADADSKTLIDALFTPPDAPAFTVASLATTTHSRPSTRPRPRSNRPRPTSSWPRPNWRASKGPAGAGRSARSTSTGRGPTATWRSRRSPPPRPTSRPPANGWKTPAWSRPSTA